MDLIDTFVSRYIKEFDFYDQAARIAARQLESDLQAEGIRCIVTSRAKSLTRLEEKIRQRNSKDAYTSIEKIYADIADLAGVRVALYFPGEREQVGHVISRLFLEYEPRRVFPAASTTTTDNRFPGYSALHYRIRLRSTNLSESERRYSSANIEVQVASVLMHAWSEVEHDLVYKPYEGKLSDEEYSLLDQLNGLVHAGEIGLEQLQKAGETRVAQTGRLFANHYELAAHLLSQASIVNEQPVTESGLGRVDLLFELLTRLGSNTPDHLKPYLEILHGDLEKRPLSEQIIDALLAANQTRYATYRSVRAEDDIARGVGQLPPEQIAYNEMGFFVAQWVKLERLIRDLVPDTAARRAAMPTGQALEKLNLLDPEMRFELDHLRRTRNNLVHGIEALPAAYLREAGERLGEIIEQIERERGLR